jgi:NAD(P)-dependent dehydrogenase (short-subunit alcohol dehydrogenase family)
MSLILQVRNNCLFFLSAAIFILRAVENTSAEDWTKILNVNVRGYALMAKAVVPLMKKQQSGSIIQMASMSGWIAQSEFVPYSTTKGAVLQMTRNLALDLGPFNIRCNAICPGTIFTPATVTHAAHLNITVEELTAEESKKQCLKRLGRPEEVANLIVFLASGLCHFATGASFAVDGGYTTI